MLALKLLAIPLVVAVVLLGIWVTGGVITDDSSVAMPLTGAWMALAGLACLAIAVRSRAFRWPVLGAYVLTAAVVGAYLGSSVLFDKVVDEQVAVAEPAPAATATTRMASSPSGRRERPRNVQIAAGRFEPVAHPASGKATAIRLAEGGRVLTLTDFEVDNGPDLRVRLAAGDDHVDLGALKGNKGNQQYDIPPGVDLRRHATVIVWCRAFAVLFARAPLER